MTEDTVSGYLQLQVCEMDTQWRKSSLQFLASKGPFHNQNKYLQVESVSKWQRMYCVLKNLQLQCYDAEAEHFSQPEITIPITKVLTGIFLLTICLNSRHDSKGCLYLFQSHVVHF